MCTHRGVYHASVLLILLEDALCVCTVYELQPIVKLWDLRVALAQSVVPGSWYEVHAS